MVNINLLPWREEELKYQKKILKRIFIFAALLAITINIIGHIILSQQENAIQKRITDNNEILKNVNKMNATDVLSHADNALPDITFIGKIFSELGKIQQPMTCFTEIKNADQTFFFRGKAQSMQDLSNYLSHWKAATFFADIKIKQIKQQENGMVRFDLEVKK